MSEEIDALEVMSIRTVPYLVSTRIVAGMVAIVPLYAVALLASYATTRAVVTLMVLLVINSAVTTIYLQLGG